MAPHGKCCGDSSHHHESSELGIQYSLYSKIDKNNLECLNEEREGSGKTVFKPWEDRLNFNEVGGYCVFSRTVNNLHIFSLSSQMLMKSYYSTSLSQETLN